MLISDNQKNPISYSVSKILDLNPVGITKVILKQDQFNPLTDNPELMIADYYKDAMIPEDANKIDIPSDFRSSIDISDWKEPKIVIGTESNVLRGIFTQDNTRVRQAGLWTTDIPVEKQRYFDISADMLNNTLNIKCQKEYSLVGMIINVTFSDPEGKHPTTQKIEVVAR